MPRSRTSKALQNNSFFSFLVHLELRRNSEENYMEERKHNVGESKVGRLDYRILNKIICSLEGY